MHLGPRTIFLGRSELPIHLPIIRKSQEKFLLFSERFLAGKQTGIHPMRKSINAYFQKAPGLCRSDRRTGENGHRKSSSEPARRRPSGTARPNYTNAFGFNGVRNLLWFGTKSHPFYLLSITVSHIPGDLMGSGTFFAPSFYLLSTSKGFNGVRNLFRHSHLSLNLKNLQNPFPKNSVFPLPSSIHPCNASVGIGHFLNLS